MEYETHNHRHVNSNFTSLQGYVKAHFQLLVGLFGPPHDGDVYKTDWEWDIEFDDGTVATIYNWKNGPNYGYQGRTPDDVTEWHVGGHTPQALENVQRLLLTRRWLLGRLENVQRLLDS